MYLLALESAAEGRQQAPATMCWLTRVGTSTPNQLNQQIREYWKLFFLYKKVKTNATKTVFFQQNRNSGPFLHVPIQLTIQQKQGSHDWTSS
jgi:hypothetical protein